jgi:hypothetical protein
MTATHTIPSNRDRVIDSRDILARLASPDPKEVEETTALTSILYYAGYDWARGITLVRADHFTEYARGMLCASGAVLSDLPDWVTIDWEATATDFRLRHSLPAIDFDGVTYWPDDQTIWEDDDAA